MNSTNLRKLSDDQLIVSLEALVRSERETTNQVLHHLREVEFRRLFSKFGFPSLFAYCVEGLGYSESAAGRRIAAMRLLKGLEPKDAQAVESQVEEGKLTLSHLSLAQTFFHQQAQADQPLSQEAKKEVLDSLVGKSARGVAEELQSRFSSEVPPIREFTRRAGHGRTEIHLVVGQEGFEKLEKIKGLYSHSHPHLGWGELIEKIAGIAWEKLDPAKEPRRKRSPKTEGEGAKDQGSALPTSGVARKRIPIRVSEVREVWRKSGHRCTYVAKNTGRACGSTRFLEIEHIVPVSCGGSNDISNLTLRCRHCNSRAAIEVLGLGKMEKFLET